MLLLVCLQSMLHNSPYQPHVKHVPLTKCYFIPLCEWCTMCHNFQFDQPLPFCYLSLRLYPECAPYALVNGVWYTYMFLISCLQYLIYNLWDSIYAVSHDLLNFPKILIYCFLCNSSHLRENLAISLTSQNEQIRNVSHLVCTVGSGKLKQWGD